jgi:hypothetical protein
MDEKFKLEINQLRGEIKMLKVKHLQLSIQFWKMNYNKCILDEDNKGNPIYFKDRKELAVKLLEVIQKEEKELATFMDAWMNNND